MNGTPVLSRQPSYSVYGLAQGWAAIELCGGEERDVFGLSKVVVRKSGPSSVPHPLQKVVVHKNVPDSLLPLAITSEWYQFPNLMALRGSPNAEITPAPSAPGYKDTLCIFAFWASLNPKISLAPSAPGYKDFLRILPFGHPKPQNSPGAFGAGI